MARKVVIKGKKSSAYFLDHSPWMHGRGAGGGRGKVSRARPSLGIFGNFPLALVRPGG